MKVLKKTRKINQIHIFVLMLAFRWGTTLSKHFADQLSTPMCTRNLRTAFKVKLLPEEKAWGSGATSASFYHWSFVVVETLIKMGLEEWNSSFLRQLISWNKKGYLLFKCLHFEALKLIDTSFQIYFGKLSISKDTNYVNLVEVT